MSEIKLRAISQIGKISRGWEKAKFVPGKGASLSIGGKTVSKENQLKSAGISAATANRYEQLPAPEEQLAPAVNSATENCFTTTAVEKQEPTFGGIVKAVRRNRPAYTSPEGL